MGDEHNRAAPTSHVVEDVGALLLEGRIPDCQHLVDQQDVGLGLDHRREREADEHSRGIVLQSQVDELAELREVEHGVQPPAGLPSGEAHHHPVERHVLAGGQLVVESDSKLDERSYAARHPNRTRVGLVDPRQDLEERALPGAVAADDAEELTAVDFEGDLSKRTQHAVLSAGERMDRSFLERIDAVRRDPKRLLDSTRLDREREVSPLDGTISGLLRWHLAEATG